MRQAIYIEIRKIIFCCLFFLPLCSFSQTENTLPVSTKDTLPVFKNGSPDLLEYLKGAVKYPDVSKQKGVEGTVIVSFIVDEHGLVKEEFISQGVDENLNKEALRVIHEMPAWNPAVKDNKPVAVQMQLPINFILKAPEKKSGEKIHNE